MPLAPLTPRQCPPLPGLSDRQHPSAHAPHSPAHASPLSPPPQAYEIDSIPLPMGHHEAAHLAKHRQAIIIVNPHKIRMSPLLAWHEVGEREAQHAGIVEGWKRCVRGGRRGA